LLTSESQCRRDSFGQGYANRAEKNLQTLVKLNAQGGGKAGEKRWRRERGKKLTDERGVRSHSEERRGPERPVSHHTLHELKRIEKRRKNAWFLRGTAEEGTIKARGGKVGARLKEKILH